MMQPRLLRRHRKCPEQEVARSIKAAGPMDDYRDHMQRFGVARVHRQYLTQQPVSIFVLLTLEVRAGSDQHAVERGRHAAGHGNGWLLQGASLLPVHRCQSITQRHGTNKLL